MGDPMTHPHMRAVGPHALPHCLSHGRGQSQVHTWIPTTVVIGDRSEIQPFLGVRNEARNAEKNDVRRHGMKSCAGGCRGG